jgi:hypothetical protein
MLQLTLKAFSILPLFVYGRTAADLARVKNKASIAERLLHRMPATHVRVLDPIFVVDRFPGGKEDDGGYFRPGREASRWMGRERNTGVPDADLRSHVFSRPRSGIIGMTARAWESATFERALFHEIAHSVDTHLGLVPPNATKEDFRGVPNPGADVVGELAAQAYFRFILNPAGVCQENLLPAGVSMAACNARVIGLLRRAPAFRSLPAAWMPGGG